MNVLPSSEVYEGDILQVFCKVVSMLRGVEVYLTMDKKILKQAPISLQHTFVASVEHTGQLVCKAVWGNVQKETYRTIRVKGKYAAVSFSFFFAKIYTFLVVFCPKQFILNVLVVLLPQSSSQSQG